LHIGFDATHNTDVGSTYSTKNPEKLADLKAKFDVAAKEFDVYPLDDRGAARLAVSKPLPPGSAPDPKTFTYYDGATRIPETAAPPMKNHSWTLTAKIKAEGPKTEGVVVGFGGLAAGLSLYLQQGVPIFDYNYFGDHTSLRGQALNGEATVEVDFAYEGGDKAGGPATITLKVNGEQAAQEKVPATVPGRFGIDTFGVGEDTGQPVTTDYKAPFRFTGEISRVDIAIK